MHAQETSKIVLNSIYFLKLIRKKRKLYKFVNKYSKRNSKPGFLYLTWKIKTKTEF